MNVSARPGFLFPGQLSEAVGMGRDFFEADGDARRLFAWTSERCDRDLERIVFSGPAAELGENLAAGDVFLKLLGRLGAQFLGVFLCGLEHPRRKLLGLHATVLNVF